MNMIIQKKTKRGGGLNNTNANASGSTNAGNNHKNKGRFAEMEVGDIIEWKNDDFRPSDDAKPRTFLTRVTKKNTYKTFREYLETEGLDKCLPGMEKFGMDYGLAVYFKYYTKENEAQYGVLAIELKVI